MQATGPWTDIGHARRTPRLHLRRADGDGRNGVRADAQTGMQPGALDPWTLRCKGLCDAK